MTLAERLRAPAPETRRAAIAALAEGGTVAPEELDALVECLGDAAKAVQRAAAEAFVPLAARGVDVGAVLERALVAGDPRRRWGAAFALALLGNAPASVLPVLLDALGAEDGDLRWAAAAIVGRVRDRTLLCAELRRLAAGGNAAQRKMALYCLRDLDLRAPEVEAAVVAALEDQAWDVRLAAIAALARIAIDRAGAAVRLVRALASDDVRVRRAAAAALGALGETSAVVLRALEAAAAAGDPSLRRAAGAALRLLGRPPSGP
jgi:HEAT repeat protein